MHPELRHLIKDVTPEMLMDDQARQLLHFLQTERGRIHDTAKIPALKPIEDYVKVLTLRYEELYQDVDTNELAYEATHVRAKLIARYVKTQKQRIARELQTTGEANQNKLLQQAKELDNLLKVYKGGA